MNITYALFVIFFFLLSIVSLNLLVGLTVDDIKEFLDEAEFKNLKLKLTFVLGIEKLYYSRYLLYTKFFLRFMNQQKFKLVHRTNRVYNNDVVSKQRIWQLILQKGIDEIKKVIYKYIKWSPGLQIMRREINLMAKLLINSFKAKWIFWRRRLKEWIGY